VVRGDALLLIRGDLRDPRRPLVTGAPAAQPEDPDSPTTRNQRVFFRSFELSGASGNRVSGRFFRLKAEATPPYRRLRVLVRAIREIRNDPLS
jgi:hypothetical protein